MTDDTREGPTDDKYEEFARLTNEAARHSVAKRHEEAIRLFQAAVDLVPRSAIGWTNLGIAKDDLAKSRGERFTGKECYENALALRRVPEAINNLGCLLMHCDGDILGACELLREATIRCHQESSAYNYAIALLMQATIKRDPAAWAVAWDWYEKRPQTMQVRGDGRLWRGEPLENRTILVGMEQGAGDQIWALRWLKRAHEQGATVYAMGNDNIKRLLAKQPYIAQTHDIGEQQHFNVDFITMAMSMPGYLMTGLPEPEDNYVITGGYAAINKRVRRIGVCWSGSVKDDYQSWRNLPFEHIQSLVSTVGGVEWVSLQKGVDAKDANGSGIDNTSISLCEDLLDTARLIQTLDLVITVDTMIPHLAAAVGVQTWLLNRWNSCWQWGAPPTYSNDPYWYGATVRQYTQETPFDWSHPMLKLANDLAGLPFGDHARGV
jgi:tetratricopeptide (TPR) repeat protein